MEYEYGIKLKRTGDIHRDGMTEYEAFRWMNPEEWDGLDPTVVFEVVRRPFGDWEVVPDLQKAATEAEEFQAAVDLGQRAQAEREAADEEVYDDVS